MAKPKGEAPVHRAYEALKKRCEKGVVVVTDRPVQERSFGRIKQLLSPYDPDLQNTVLFGWDVFEVEIPPGSHSGRHRHQGGIAIFIVEGRGYTVIDGRRHNWKAGDLVLLPFRPGGVEHQHFNADSKQSARYVPFIYDALIQLGGYVEIEQTAARPSEELALLVRAKGKESR